MRTAAIVAVSALAGLGVGAQTAPDPVTVYVPAPAPQVLICPAGPEEDHCYPDFIGDGRWVIRTSEPHTEEN